MKDHYTKLWGQILESTLWHNDRDVILLWIVMLAKKDKDHVVSTPIPTLAEKAKITCERCEECLAILAAPDKYSSSKEYEGRRIQKVEAGWLILNGRKYQDLHRQEQRREAVAKANRAYRERKKNK